MNRRPFDPPALLLGLEAAWDIHAPECVKALPEDQLRAFVAILFRAEAASYADSINTRARPRLNEYVGHMPAPLYGVWDAWWLATRQAGCAILETELGLVKAAEVTP